jgi:hypothetical protein
MSFALRSLEDWREKEGTHRLSDYEGLWMGGRIRKTRKVWMAYCLVVYYADPDSGSHE